MRVRPLSPVRFAAIAAAVVLIAGLVPGVASGTGPSGPQPGDAVASDQLIVRWADGSAGAANGATSDAPSVGALPNRVAAVSVAAGHPATWQRTLAVGGDVYRLDAWLAPAAMALALSSVRALPGVLYAEPDGIAHADATPPNDPYWSQQWDLSQGTTPTTYGIDLLGAWDRSQGSGVVVAVIDTGITVHTDLAGQTVAGYDFISSVAMANDGSGRDSDPSDPGDWVAIGDSCYNPTYGLQRSSWHGTHVSGTVAASTNNAVGIAGIAYRAKVQPVRVLGKCGGYFSDITDGLTWASGGAVAGVPANATPARVANLSLSGSGACPTSLQSAITSAAGRGTVVAVAAGNNSANASAYTPANCNGVITVAATTSAGARASFSNYGSAVEIAAPGVSLWSTLNTGGTTPGSPTYAQYSGTSMATPHVAGVAALMLAAKPGLSPASVLFYMQQTAHPFGPSGCSGGCGTGIVDAAKAVAAAAGGSPTPTPTPSGTPGPTPTPTSAPTPTPGPGCVRGTPVATASATYVFVPRGSSSTVTLSVRNTDGSACGSSTFTWSAALVSGPTAFTSTVSPVSVTVAPGTTVTATARIAVSTAVAMGTSAAFQFRATRAASPTTAIVSVSAFAW